MLSRMFEFVLDLALDWDNVEDYTQYAVEEPEVIEQRHQAIVEMPVDVVISESASEADSWYELKSDPREWQLPIFRGGVSVEEAEDRLERSAKGLWEFGREIVVWD